MSIPFDPTRAGVTHEYRCAVSDMTAKPPVQFITGWQTREYALNTYDTLKAAMPNVGISMQRRTLRVEDFTP